MPAKTEVFVAGGSVIVNGSNGAVSAFDKQGNPNYMNIGLGSVQTIHATFDLGTKSLQASSLAWGRAVPGVGAVLGGISLATQDTSKTFWTGDWANWLAVEQRSADSQP